MPGFTTDSMDDEAKEDADDVEVPGLFLLYVVLYVVQVGK